MSVSELLKDALERIEDLEGFDRVRFIIHYGSSAVGGVGDASDIDLAVYFDGSDSEAMDFRFKVLSCLFNDVFDVQIFNLLPLYVRVEVLKGRVLYSSDDRFLHDVAYKTIREFESFKHRFYDYIGEQVIV